MIIIQLMLQFADEHLDSVSTVSCSLAKHRKSDTIDRKDVQLAYGKSRVALSWMDTCS